MAEPFDTKCLRASQRFLAEELLARGVFLSHLDAENEVLEAIYGDHRELILDIDSSIMPFSASAIASSKSLTRKLLTRAGISVPRGGAAGVNDIGAIGKILESVRFPVVVKPSNGSQGEDVFMDLESEEDVFFALQVIERDRGCIEVLIEEQFEGNEYRVFVTRSGAYAALLREPAAVVGDGEKTIEQLAEWESNRRLNPRLTCLGRIVLDDEVDRFLRRQGKTRAYRPLRGEKVYLRRTSNVSLGGVPTDVTTKLNESVLRICLSALQAVPGLPYAGVDFMTRDISQPQHSQTYCILELNPLPGIGMHAAPGGGESRNVAGMIVDEIFPETIGQARAWGKQAA